MYLVSHDHFHKTTKQLAQPSTSIKKKKEKVIHKSNPHHKRKKKTHVTEKQHSYHKLVMFRKKIEETDLKREALIKEIAKFLGRVLPKHTTLQQLPTKIEPLERACGPHDDWKKKKRRYPFFPQHLRPPVMLYLRLLKKPS